MRHCFHAFDDRDICCRCLHVTELAAPDGTTCPGLPDDLKGDD